MIFRGLTLLVALALFPVLVAGGDANTGELGWLAGCWTNPDGSSQEVWVVESEQSLAGFSANVSNNTITFYELMSIKRSEDGSWIFTAYPSGQTSASFKAVEIDENSVVFANSEHDYPQEIRYSRNGDQLSASISLIDGAEPNSFDKIACN